MKSFSITDTGMHREINEDFCFASDTPIGNLPNLYIVADGMGGHAAGEYASRYTVERVVASISRNQKHEPVPVITDAVNKANEILISESKSDITKQGMGTTLVVATITEEAMYVANIGDSRLYVIGQEMKQVTRDHSLVGEMIRLGEMEPESAKDHPDKNIITRAIGVFEKVEADFFEVELLEGQTVLMCSDGLTNMLDDADIYQIVNGQGSLEEKCKTLVSIANRNGGKDNVTVVLMKP